MTTPMHIAAAAGDEATVVDLLECGLHAFCFMVDNRMRTPLHLAAKGGHVAIVRRLLDVSDDLATMVDDVCCLPLHLAAARGRASAVQVLLAAKPHTVMEEDIDGWYPVHRAAMSGDVPTIEILLNAAPDTLCLNDNCGELTPLLHAAAYGRVEAARFLITRSSETLQGKDAALQTALHHAAEAGSLAIVKELYRAAPGLVETLDMEELVPLDHALHGEPSTHAWGEEHPAVLRFLLEVTPADMVMYALAYAWKQGGPPRARALPLFAEVLATRGVHPEFWEYVPFNSPGLGAILPAVLARSRDEARELVLRLPASDSQRLEEAALCLSRLGLHHASVLDRILPYVVDTK